MNPHWFKEAVKSNSSCYLVKGGKEKFQSASHPKAKYLEVEERKGSCRSSGMKTLVVWPSWQGYYHHDKLSSQWRVVIKSI